MNNLNVNNPHVEHCYTKHCYTKCCTSWNGIFVGALVAIGLTILFHILTLGIGLTSFTTTENGVLTLAIAGFAWLFIGSYIIYFIAGWIAGRFICHYTVIPSKGFLQGFLAWSLTLVIGIILLSNLTPFTNLELVPDRTVPAKTAVISNTTVTNTSDVAVVQPVTEKEIHKAGIATLSTFLIFLSGALGSSLGGYCAVKYCKKEDEPYDRKDKEHKEIL